MPADDWTFVTGLLLFSIRLVVAVVVLADVVADVGAFEEAR